MSGGLKFGRIYRQHVQVRENLDNGKTLTEQKLAARVDNAIQQEASYRKGLRERFIESIKYIEGLAQVKLEYENSKGQVEKAFEHAIMIYRKENQYVRGGGGPSYFKRPPAIPLAEPDFGPSPEQRKRRLEEMLQDLVSKSEGRQGELTRILDETKAWFRTLCEETIKPRAESQVKRTRGDEEIAVAVGA